MWRDIKGFEGRYQMSEDREVKRLPYSVTQKGFGGTVYTRNFGEKILEQNIDDKGYLYVDLGNDRYRIHWLYYNTFIGNSTGYFIDHIDRNKLNNDPSNLRLLTQKLNNYNRTLAYKPDIQYRPTKSKNKPYYLRFSEDGKRINIGSFATYEEAENKYRELYNERQNKINDCSKILSIDN